jgi:hypothetical protein
MMTFLQAIARQEGFHSKWDPHNTPTSYHNPGDIQEGEFAQAHGALPPVLSAEGTVVNRFAMWPDDQSGIAAMRALLVEDYLGLTVTQAIRKWAPPVENDDSTYIADVCQWAGLTPSTVLTAELIG